MYFIIWYVLEMGLFTWVQPVTGNIQYGHGVILPIGQSYNKRIETRHWKVKRGPTYYMIS